MNAVAAKTPEKSAISSHLRSVPDRKIVGTKTVLTRRGQVVIGLLIAAFALGALSLVVAVFAPSASAATSTESVRTEVVVVQPGQTLWQIATDLDPSSDPREIIERILDLNSLSNEAQIHAGQALILPNLN